MFECSSCTTRAIRALVRDTPRHLRSSGRRLVLTPKVQLGQQRRNAVALSQAQIAKDDQAVPFDAGTADLGISPVPKRHLEIELRWLGDKVKFANHVRDLIHKKNEFDKALALVRLASRSQEQVQCVVAWNHLLRYTLEKGEMEKAFTMYNEMKKRAQVPDAHTYMTMFKGLAGSDRSKLPRPKQIARVVTIYNSMYAPNSKVKPTVLHANAALHVCSLGNDMDALWGILSRLEDEGPNSADAITYTVVLNAIRATALKSMLPDASLDQLRAHKVQAVQQGRELWTDIVKKWRSGQIQMDEQLIIAMAQLLLLSPHLKDWDDVLSLIQQTMDIDRLVDAVGSSSRKIEHVPQQHDAFIDIEAPTATSPVATAISEAFRPLKETAESSAKKDGKLDTFKFARPSAGTLATILETCFVMRTPKTATDYWKHLTEKPYRVRPDIANVELFLRICAVNRSSAAATSFLEEVLAKHSIKPRSRTLHYAMQSCQRNIKSPTSLDHAGKIVDVMAKYLEDPDVTILIQYLQLALHTDDGDKIARVLNHMDGSIHNLRSMVINGSNQASTRAIWAETLTNASTLHQGMIGAIDTLIKRELVPQETFKLWHARRSEMNKFVTTLGKLLGTLPVTVETQRPRTDGVSQYDRGRLEQSSDNHDSSEEKGMPSRRRREKHLVHLRERDTIASSKQFSALKKFRYGSRPDRGQDGQFNQDSNGKPRAAFGQGLKDLPTDFLPM